jgi:hypothetical protein
MSEQETTELLPLIGGGPTDGHIKRVVISPRTFRYRTSDITTHLEKGIVA